MPAVTVALLCWNQEQYVREAIESIGAQSLSDFELVVVDNASTDASLVAITGALGGLQVPHRVIENPVNVGISRALNQALEISTGRYFVPFAADDIMLPGRLEHQVGLIDSLGDDVGGVVSSCRVIDPQGAPRGLFRPPMVSSMRELRLSLVDGSARPAAGTMLRRSTLESLGGYDPASPFEDLDMAARIVFELGKYLHPDPTIVSLYRRHNGNTTSNPRVMAAGLAYTHARLGDLPLTGREKREIRRLALRSISMTWFRFTNAIGAGDAVAARRLALAAAGQCGLRLSQRVKALGFVLMPGRAMAMFRGREEQNAEDPR